VRTRQAVRADLDAIADVWVDAFSGDPFLRWMGDADDASWPAFGRAWLSFIAGMCFERGHMIVTEPAGAAVAWIPPDLSMMGPGDMDRAAAIIAEHAGDARRDEAVTTMMAAGSHSSPEPHWTLQYIGVGSALQGQGVGAALVGPYLRRCDEDGLPCGLVSSNPRNVPFYERFGFTVTAEVPNPDGSATLRPMLRHPSPD
jgi:GNAT superfamily N-acetyltransferase